MTADMLNGDSLIVGNVTSGGTESILMAMKAYRDRARALLPHITDPEMVSWKRNLLFFCEYIRDGCMILLRGSGEQLTTFPIF